MEEISIVRKRSRLWPILLFVLLVVVILLAVLWLMGSPAAADFGRNDIVEPVRRIINGTA